MVDTPPAEDRLLTARAKAHSLHRHEAAGEVSLTLRIDAQLELAILREAGEEGDKSKVVRRILRVHFGLEE